MSKQHLTRGATLAQAVEFLDDRTQAQRFAFDFVEKVLATARPTEEIATAVLFPAANGRESVIMVLAESDNPASQQQLLEKDLPFAAKKIGAPLVIFISAGSRRVGAGGAAENAAVAFDVVVVNVIGADGNDFYVGNVDWEQDRAVYIHWNQVVGKRLPMGKHELAIQRGLRAKA